VLLFFKVLQEAGGRVFCFTFPRSTLLRLHHRLPSVSVVFHPSTSSQNTQTHSVLGHFTHFNLPSFSSLLRQEFCEEGADSFFLLRGEEVRVPSFSSNERGRLSPSSRSCLGMGWRGVLFALTPFVTDIVIPRPVPRDVLPRRLRPFFHLFFF